MSTKHHANVGDRLLIDGLTDRAGALLPPTVVAVESVVRQWCGCDRARFPRPGVGDGPSHVEVYGQCGRHVDATDFDQARRDAATHPGPGVPRQEKS